MTEKQILSLRAVLYGCMTNLKLENAIYKTLSSKHTISFDEATNIVSDMIAQEIEKTKED